jgi:hypothetical protein
MRARNLKPSFFKNEALAECSALARLLFAGLWCLADREGRLEDRPKRIRAELLPYDDGSIEDMLSELHDAGFILRYSATGGRFIQVVNFTKHQYPHRKEQASTIHAPDMPEASPVQVQGITGTCPAESLIPHPESLIPCSDADASVVAGKPVDACPAERIIELYHQYMPANPRCKVLNDKRRAMIRQRWREAARLEAKPFGYGTQAEGVAAWSEFFQVCAESEFLTGRVPGRNGAPPFVADVDFLFSPGGFAKCIENKYHREAT